jgi:cytochrome c-type biogenesis protein CcmE
MEELTTTKSGSLANRPASRAGNRAKFIVGGVLILAAVIYLIVSSSQANAQYFLTVDELMADKSANMGRDLRISGAVIDDPIRSQHPQADLHGCPCPG